MAESTEIAQQPPEILAWVGACLRSANKLEAALTVLQSAQQRAPTDFWINYELGKCLSLRESPTEALGFIRAAVALRPKSMAAHWSLVAALDDADRSEESQLAFDRMLKASQMSSMDYAWLGDSLLRRGRYAQALAAIAKALDLDPVNATAYQIRAHVYANQELPNEMLVAAKKAVELAPTTIGRISDWGGLTSGLVNLKRQSRLIVPQLT